jgi:hypothetical protein
MLRFSSIIYILCINMKVRKKLCPDPVVEVTEAASEEAASEEVASAAEDLEAAASAADLRAGTIIIADRFLADGIIDRTITEEVVLAVSSGC